MPSAIGDIDIAARDDARQRIACFTSYFRRARCSAAMPRNEAALRGTFGLISQNFFSHYTPPRLEYRYLMIASSFLVSLDSKFSFCHYKR